MMACRIYEQIRSRSGWFLASIFLSFLLIDQLFCNPFIYFMAFLWLFCWFPKITTLVIMLWNRYSGKPISLSLIIVFLSSIFVYVDGAVSGYRDSLTQSYIEKTAPLIEEYRHANGGLPADLTLFPEKPVLAYAVDYSKDEMSFLQHPYGPVFLYNFKSKTFEYDER